MVDFHALFMDVNIGGPGKVYNAKVLLTSPFTMKVWMALHFNSEKKSISGFLICLCIYCYIMMVKKLDQ